LCRRKDAASYETADLIDECKVLTAALPTAYPYAEKLDHVVGNLVPVVHHSTAVGLIRKPETAPPVTMLALTFVGVPPVRGTLKSSRT
jgi:hypothetical protein